MIMIPSGFLDQNVSHEFVSNGLVDLHVVQQIVRNSMERHGGGLRNEIVVDLVVCQPPEWVEDENSARLHTTVDLIHPGVIESHPTWLVGHNRWLDSGPKCLLADMLIPAILARVPGEKYEFAEHGFGGLPYVQLLPRDE
jgi:hypothetical protein